MSRRIAREMVLQTLFQVDASKADPMEALTVALQEQDSPEAQKSMNYAEKVIKGTLAQVEAIDEKIGKYAIDWEVKRMSGIDRNILRMAIYEMLYAEEKVPAGVAINEAVEIAKVYGSDETPKFVNGILGKLMRDEQ